MVFVRDGCDRCSAVIALLSPLTPLVLVDVLFDSNLFAEMKRLANSTVLPQVGKAICVDVCVCVGVCVCVFEGKVERERENEIGYTKREIGNESSDMRVSFERCLAISALRMKERSLTKFDLIF